SARAVPLRAKTAKAARSSDLVTERMCLETRRTRNSLQEKGLKNSLDGREDLVERFLREARDSRLGALAAALEAGRDPHERRLARAEAGEPAEERRRLEVEVARHVAPLDAVPVDDEHALHV